MYCKVSNIKINNNEPYDVGLPAEFDDEYLSKIFLRTHAFDYKEITFDYEEVSVHQFHTTEMQQEQPLNRDFTDRKYDDVAHIRVYASTFSTTLVYIKDEDLAYNEGDVNQAIYEMFLFYLPVEFVYARL